MHTYNNNKMIIRLLTLSIASTVLVACEDQKQHKNSLSAPVQTYQQIKVLKGSVTDENGSVIDAKIKVEDSAGKMVAQTQLENSKNYKVEIPQGTTLPIVLTVSPKGSEEQLIAVIISPSVSSYDISPLTTKIAKRAKALGGYTYANMVMAADSTVGVPDANKTSTGFRGDPTKQYGGWH
ncbi:MAG: hypothetical protein K9L22_10400 [Methylococcaceae bacterium]|nr:hypothetical protein [Methylococcaceae bacterium]